MSKSEQEIASEIVMEALKARGQALAGIGSNNSAVGANHLSGLTDAGVVSLYKNVLAAVKSHK